MKDIWLDTGTPPRRHENAPSPNNFDLRPLAERLANGKVQAFGPACFVFVDEAKFNHSEHASRRVADPVRKATRKRIDAWINGDRGVV